MTFSHPTRLDEVNDQLRLMQFTDGLTFGTDALLLAAYIKKDTNARAIEFGGGSGIISLLVASREKVASVECVEIQPDYADLIAYNIRENGLEDRINVTCADIRNYAEYGVGRDADIVFTNPPYMRDDGVACRGSAKQIARHEVMGGIDDFARAAGKKLRWGGRFYCVWRPDRLNELLSALTSHGIEPKRMTLVHASPVSDPSMLLLEAVRGGMPGMWVTRPLIIGGNTAERAESADMCYILEKGSFPSHYDQR